MSLSIYQPIYLANPPSILLAFTHLSTTHPPHACFYASTHLRTHLSTQLSTHALPYLGSTGRSAHRPSIHPSAHRPTSSLIYACFYPPTHPRVHLSIQPSTHPPTYPSTKHLPSPYYCLIPKETELNIMTLTSRSSHSNVETDASVECDTRTN